MHHDYEKSICNFDSVNNLITVIISEVKTVNKKVKKKKEKETRTWWQLKIMYKNTFQSR